MKKDSMVHVTEGCWMPKDKIQGGRRHICWWKKENECFFFFAGIKFGTFRVYLEKIRIKYGNSHSRLESHGRKTDTMGRIWISNALNSHRRRPHFILWIKGSRLGLWHNYLIVLHSAIPSTGANGNSHPVVVKALQFLTRQENKIPDCFPTYCAANSNSTLTCLKICKGSQCPSSTSVLSTVGRGTLL